MAKRKVIDKENYAYYKIMYRSNLKRAIQRGFDSSDNMLTEGEWQRAHDIKGASNSDIVFEQTHRYDRKTTNMIRSYMKEFTDKLKKEYKEKGLKFTFNSRKTFDSYTEEEKNLWWKFSREVYDEIRESGIVGAEAEKMTSQMLYGSA